MPPAHPAAPQTSGHPQVATTKHDEWRLSVTPYLWLPGVHGTVGAFDRDAGVSASPIDLLSHFRFGLMGTVDARWKRLVLPLDVFWVRLADDKAVPRLGLGATTADVKVSIFMLTPKVGVRLLDEPKIKCDFLTGFRYWHLGQNLKFSPVHSQPEFFSPHRIGWIRWWEGESRRRFHRSSWPLFSAMLADGGPALNWNTRWAAFWATK